MRNLLGGAICPRCLTPVANRRYDTLHVECHKCGFSIPAIYLREIKNTPPIFVQIIGLTMAGKTTYQDMLRHQLYRMSKMWPDAFAMPITETEMEHKPIVNVDRARGILAAGDRPRTIDQNDVYIMRLMNMERWKSHFLVLMDFSGEQFGPLYLSTDDIPFLRSVPVTVMMLSLPDMKTEGKTMEDVLYSYIITLENQRIKLAKRQLIIVFNKADLIGNLPQEVNSYLFYDQLYQQLKDQQRVPYMSGKYLSQYLYQMDHISEILGQWVLSVEGGAGLWAMLKHKRIGVRFCAMSATGHQINKAAPKELRPQRIFDPFFWVMEYYAQHW